ncbi:phage virion morphogenesis protein [Helicobacter valdiviensis]|uniref:Phage virion morphogenesis protein n=1 Tax=Helicobacter valdiviensis TaxID=1458358 RepID=A0A2W6MRW3_9HELI|nr:phage virion morphogenesis protein [Helicobacter valdiviensis]PZT47304.1 phage virion morphogenesis protein [Helicobacter valdiviensis]
MESFKLSGLENLLKTCSKLDKEQKDIILKEIIAEGILKHTQENFEKEQDSNGKAWKPLKDTTLKARRYANPKITHNKILTRRGTLSSSLNYKIENDTAKIGVNASFKGYQYGKAHQFGTSKIPARPFFPFNEKLEINPRVAKELEEETKDMLLKVFKKELK